MIEDINPITVQIHPNLKFELDKRKEMLTLNHVPNAPFRTASLLAAFELETIRKSRKELERDFLNLKNPNIFDFGGSSFVKIEEYIKLFNFASSIHKKKDQKQINVDFSKIKGIRKNDVQIFW